MAYSRGSQYDRQYRVAQDSQNYGSVHGPLPLRTGGGGGSIHISMPPAFLGRPAPKEAPGYVDGTEFWLLAPAPIPPGQSTLDSRRPLGFSRPVYRLAVYDANCGNTLLPELLGKDAMVPGQSTLDTRRPAAFLTRQSRLTATSNQYDQVHGTPNPLQGKDAFPPGQSTYDSKRPAVFFAKAFRYPVYDANSGNAFLPEQVVATIPNGQSTRLSELPPRSAPRAVDLLTFVDASEVWLFGTDALNAGAQFTDLALRAALRAPDYSYTDATEFWLFGTDAVNAGAQRTELPPIVAPRIRDYTWIQELIPDLIGQDAMAAGAQLSGNAPAGPRRAADYTHTQNQFPNLVGQDAMLVGAQSYALPPIAALRARDYSFTPPINLPALTTVVQQIPNGQQLTDALPPRAAARLRDYTHTQDLIPDLIGQDAVNAGAQSFALAPSPAPLRARDYSIAESFPLTLIAQDAFNAGKQSFDLPPIAALRARDYSFVPPANLCCLTTVQQPIPPGQQTTDSLPPKAALRARDYTYLWPAQTKLIGQDAFPTGQNADRTALPPKAAQRARDYTFLDLTKQNLIGQDRMVTGQSWLRTDNLPPRAYARLVDYSWFQSFSLPELQLTTKPGHHALSDRALFLQTLTDRALYIHSLTDRALMLHNLRDQEAGG